MDHVATAAHGRTASRDSIEGKPHQRCGLCEQSQCRIELVERVRLTTGRDGAKRN